MDEDGLDTYQADEISPNASQVREESFSAGRHSTISRTPSLKYPLLNCLQTISEVCYEIQQIC